MVTRPIRDLPDAVPYWVELPHTTRLATVTLTWSEWLTLFAFALGGAAAQSAPPPCIYRRLQIPQPSSKPSESLFLTFAFALVVLPKN